MRPNVIHLKHVTNTSVKEGGLSPSPESGEDRSPYLPAPTPMGEILVRIVAGTAQDRGVGSKFK